MFIGHFALAFGAKKTVPRTSLATLVAAAQLLDLIWPLLVLLGVETVRIDAAAPSPFLYLWFVRYPWSHSLAMAIVWGAVFAIAYRTKARYARGAAVVFALAVSHWVLDWITHRPDLQLAPGIATRVGLGLWSSPAATVAVEGALFVAGLAVYLRTTRARDRAGRWGLWGFVAFLLLAYLSSLAGGAPPSANAVAATVLVGFALIPWIAWFDRHRDPTELRDPLPQDGRPTQL